MSGTVTPGPRPPVGRLLLCVTTLLVALTAGHAGAEDRVASVLGRLETQAAALDSGAGNLSRVEAALTATRAEAAALGARALPGLTRLLADPRYPVRLHAALTLEAVGTERAVALAAGMYVTDVHNGDPRDPSPSGFGQLYAMRAKALPFVAAALASSADFQRQHDLVLLLQAIGDPGAAPALRRLVSDRDGRLVQVALEALGACRADGALAELSQQLDHGDALARFGAVRGLMLLGDPAALRTLLATLESDKAAVTCWWPGCPPGAAPTVAGAAAEAIDALTGQSFRGDLPRIRAWLSAHPGG